MRTRKLGSSNIELTTVGLGTWAMGGPWQFGWGPQDDDEAIAAVLKAIDLGVNWIDTAAVYGLGHSEELVGKALRQTKQKPFIATKCSRRWDEKGQMYGCLKRESVRMECHASLKRLGIETIDLYQIHWAEPQEDIEEAWEEVVGLQRQGKVRFLGVSNFNVEQINRVGKIAPVASLQPPYNMLRREVEDELLGYCARNGIGVIAYSPMARGLLTGKFSRQRLAGLPLDDHRRKYEEFQDPKFTATLELVEQLRPIAKRNGKTMAQLAIAWVLRRPEVTAAIVGARRPSQITETADASDWDLAEKDIDKIEQLLAERLTKIS
jgi:aryl-alcohol dehydrogenase-like predicted oxidoreductase